MLFPIYIFKIVKSLSSRKENHVHLNRSSWLGKGRQIFIAMSLTTFYQHFSNFSWISWQFRIQKKYIFTFCYLQGTTKPTHYHVLWNDSKLNADQIQKLTYYLCHIYSRCERSVSYPAPTYYAHLAAFRAREHNNALIANTTNKVATEVKQEYIDQMQNITLMNYFTWWVSKRCRN